MAATPAAGWRALVEAQQAPPEDWRAAVRRSTYPTPASELSTSDAPALWMDGPDMLGALVLHGGDETYQLGERILAAPWWRVM